MQFLNSLRASCPPDHGWSYITNDKNREWSGSLSFKPVKNTTDLSSEFYSHQLASTSRPATTASEWKPLVNENITTGIVALNTRKTGAIGKMNDEQITVKPDMIKYENRTELSGANSRKVTDETTTKSEITEKIVRCPKRVYLSGTSSLHKRYI